AARAPGRCGASAAFRRPARSTKRPSQHERRSALKSSSTEVTRRGARFAAMAVLPDAPASPGYVQLRRQPYRGHQLLIDAVLRNSRPGDRVFDGGVSSGYLARELVDAGLVVDGVELDPVAAEEARQVCSTVVVGDLQHLDLSTLPRYDVVLFGDTLEHPPAPA